MLLQLHAATTAGCCYSCRMLILRACQHNADTAAAVQHWQDSDAAPGYPAQYRTMLVLQHRSILLTLQEDTHNAAGP